MMVWYGKKGSGDCLYLGFCIAHTHIYTVWLSDTRSCRIVADRVSACGKQKVRETEGRTEEKKKNLIPSSHPKSFVCYKKVN